jgi:preprotein translocase subunit SecE
MIQYLKEVRAEMKHVSWPTRTQTIVYTAVVIGISLATAVYLGLLDYVFSQIIFRIV